MASVWSLVFLHLALVFSLTFGMPLFNGDFSGDEVQPFGAWKVFTNFSECSNQCGGGLKVRTVHCVDQDNVFSSDCGLSDRPAGFELCAQLTCFGEDAGNNSEIFPKPKNYSFALGQLSSAVVDFIQHSEETYEAVVDITEEYSVKTKALYSVTPQGISATDVQVEKSESPLLFGVRVNGVGYFLQYGGEDLMYLDENTRGLDTEASTRLHYRNNSIWDLEGEIYLDNIVTFYYVDYYRVYAFTEEKIASVSGPGHLFWQPQSGVAVYILHRDSDNVENPFENVITSIFSFIHSGASPTPSEEIAGPGDLGSSSSSGHFNPADVVNRPTYSTATDNTEEEGSAIQPHSTTSEQKYGKATFAPPAQSSERAPESGTTIPSTLKPSTEDGGDTILPREEDYLTMKPSNELIPETSEQPATSHNYPEPTEAAKEATDPSPQLPVFPNPNPGVSFGSGSGDTLQ